MSSARGACGGSSSAPDLLAVLGLGEREVDHEVEPADERVVDVAAEVGGQDHRARDRPPSAAAGRRPRCSRSGRASPTTSERLPNSASASSKNRIALEPSAAAKIRVEVLLGLADVLRDDRGQVDAEQLAGRARRPAPARPSSCRCRTRRRTGPSAPACARPCARSPSPTAPGRGGAGSAEIERSSSRWRSGSTRSSQR